MSEREIRRGDLDLDPTLEHALRSALRQRDPGPATVDLRRRVDRIPASEPVREPLLHRAAPYLAVAAALVVLVGGLGALTSGGPGTGTGPGAGAVPAFDPYATGIGVVDAPRQPLVVLVVAAATAFAFYGAGLAGGRRGGALAVLFLMVPGLFLATQLLPAPRQNAGAMNPEWGLTDGADLGFSYGLRGGAVVTAEAGDPYWLEFYVSNGGPLPVRIDGIVPTTTPGVTDAPSLWLSSNPETADLGPDEPFKPVVLAPGESASLWLVQRASSCSVGAGYVPGSTVAGESQQDAIALRWSVLGVPRLDGIELPWLITTLLREGCAG